MRAAQKRIPDAADADLAPPTRRELLAYWAAWIMLAAGIAGLLILAWAAF
jgi:hypothetical protein